MSDEHYLYHYTSVDATVAIISSQSFRATNFTTFEDNNELFGGLDPIAQYLHEIERAIGLNGLSKFSVKQIAASHSGLSMYKFFCISFCREDNYDFMWNRYAKEGCCLIFDREKLLNSFLHDNSNPLKRRDITISIVSGDFMPCIYLHKKDIMPQINIHLDNLKMTQTQCGQKNAVPFDFSSPNVYCRQLTWDDIKNPEKAFDALPCIDITENFLNLIKPALLLKFAGTDQEYEKEKEDRMVLLTPSSITEKQNGKKSYIEVNLNTRSFFEALSGVKINPNAPAVIKQSVEDRMKTLSEALILRGIVKSPINIV